MLKVKKKICEAIVTVSFVVALCFVTAISNGDMEIWSGFWKIAVCIGVMTAAAWKRGWLK